MNNIAYIALGSNIGERYTYLTEAIQFLNKILISKLRMFRLYMRRNRLAILTKVAFKFSYKNFYQFITARIIESNAKVENDLGRKKLGGDLGLSTLTFYYIIKKILKQRILLFRIRGCSKELLLSFRC